MTAEHVDQDAALPWDDQRRLPALLRQVENEALRQQRALEHEYRLWRSHQPALRTKPWDGMEDRKDFYAAASVSRSYGLAVSQLSTLHNDLGRVAWDARYILDQLEGDEG